MNWQNWLQEGPARGLGRQHRMSRSAIAWTHSKIAKPPDLILSDMDVVDGLTTLEMEEVTHACEQLATPLNAQQPTDSEANGWGCVWG